MSRTDYRTLVDRGRKAGLRTNELYSALNGGAREGVDRLLGVTDSNGFVSSFDRHGQLVYHPVNSQAPNS
jgi:hypothetical protein